MKNLNQPVKTLGQRIEKVRQNKRMSHADIAQKMKLSRGAVAQWISDKTSPSILKVMELSRILEVDPSWLAFGIDSGADKVVYLDKSVQNGTTPPAEVEPPEGAITVPEVDYQSREGKPLTLRQWAFPEEFVRYQLRTTPDNVVMVEVVDNMMAPGIVEGDRVLIDTTKTKPYPPGVFGFWNGMAVTLRRLETETLPGADGVVTIHVRNDNKDYPDETETLDKVQPHIIGRVVGVCKKA